MENKDYIEIYKLHAELSDRISQRRGQANQFYTTLLTTLIGAMGYVLSGKSELFFTIKIIGTVGCTISLIWILNIFSYKHINSAKFRVLQEMEKELPFQFFTKEYEKLRTEKWYFNLSKTEILTPIIFLILFIVSLIIF